MRSAVRKIAMERMQILIDNAISNAKTNPELSQRQAFLARRISSRHKIRMPYPLRMVFCKKCKLKSNEQFSEYFLSIHDICFIKNIFLT